MYAAARAIKRADKAPRKTVSTQVNVIFPILCLFFVAFLVAGTIVLALLPLYLPQKAVTTSPTSQTYLLTFALDAPIGNDGYLNEAARDEFAQAIGTGMGAKTGSVNVTQGTVVTQASKRKRRTSIFSRRRRRRAEDDEIFSGVQRLYIEFYIDYRVCGARCRSPEYIRRLIGHRLDLTFFYDDRSCSFHGVCDYAPTKKYTVPPVTPGYGKKSLSTTTTTPASASTASITTAASTSTAASTVMPTSASSASTTAATPSITTATSTALTTASPSATPNEDAGSTGTTIVVTSVTSNDTTTATTATGTTTAHVQPTPDLII